MKLKLVDTTYPEDSEWVHHSDTGIILEGNCELMSEELVAMGQGWYKFTGYIRRVEE